MAHKYIVQSDLAQLSHCKTFDLWPPLFCLCLIHYQDGGFGQHLQRAQYVHGGADWSLRDHRLCHRTLAGHPRWAWTGHEYPWRDRHRLCHPGVLHQRRKYVFVNGNSELMTKYFEEGKKRRGEIRGKAQMGLSDLRGRWSLRYIQPHTYSCH